MPIMMSVTTLIALMFSFIPSISSSLSSVYFCLNNQSVIYLLGPGLYYIHILYRCILSRLYWSHCDNIVVPFLNIATKSLWSVWAIITLTSLARQQGWNFSNHEVFLAHFCMLLCCLSAPDRLWLANVMGHSIVLSIILS